MDADVENLRALIEAHQGLVRSLARNIFRRLCPRVELDDLVAYGQVGLAQAARDYDPRRGNQFATYAYYRIRGAIYDGLAKENWFGRSENQPVGLEPSFSLASGQADPGHPANIDEEVAEAEWRLLRDLKRALVRPLSVHGRDGEDGHGGLEDVSAPEAHAVIIRRETTQKLHQLVDGLLPEARALIRAKYFEGLSLQEAGHRLGMSKSWASRLHARALRELARKLQQDNSNVRDWDG